MSREQKINRIKSALEEMAVGACSVKWDLMVWRVSESGWIVGESGVRKDAVTHDLASAVDWFAWKRGIAA